MSIFEKLGFKKKKEFGEEDIDLASMGESRAELPPLRSPSMPGFDSPEPSPAEIPRAPFEGQRAQNDSRGVELINAKLDAIKAILDNISSRIERLEKIAAGEEIPRWR